MQHIEAMAALFPFLDILQLRFLWALRSKGLSGAAAAHSIVQDLNFMEIMTLQLLQLVISPEILEGRTLTSCTALLMDRHPAQCTSLQVCMPDSD